jgi:hypothetical protein
MSNTQQLILYSRPDCHLCDEAIDMLRRIGIAFSVKNIERDVGLIRRYDLRIPVLSRNDGTSALDWPFSEEQVREFLGETEEN